MTTSAILTAIGVILSFYKVFVNPYEYFQGLFKPVTDSNKSDSLYLIIVVFTIICAPANLIFDIPLRSLDVVAAGVFLMVLIWKSYEILINAQAYFSGLFKDELSGNKTSFEPLGMVVISLIVIYAYFSQMI